MLCYWRWRLLGWERRTGIVGRLGTQHPGIRQAWLSRAAYVAFLGQQVCCTCSMDGVVLKQLFNFFAWQQLCLAWRVARALADKTALRCFAISQPSGLLLGKTSEGPRVISVNLGSGCRRKIVCGEKSQTNRNKLPSAL